MKKALKLMVFIGILLLTVTGCNTTKSYTYSVETGDNIKIKLNTTDGYDITSDLPFVISKDDKTLSQGTFVTLDTYNQYVQIVNQDSRSTILDSGNKNGVEYLFYSYNNSEYNYIIKVNNSNTGVILANPNSKEEAEKCFELLTFSVE